MQTKRLLPSNPFSDIVETFHYDDTIDRMVIQRVQDVEPYLERNKYMRNHVTQNKNSSFRMLADIPLSVVEIFLKKHGCDVFNPTHEKKLLKLLHSREYAYLRCMDGTFL